VAKNSLGIEWTLLRDGQKNGLANPQIRRYPAGRDVALLPDQNAADVKRLQSSLCRRRRHRARRAS
jgi:hypothetical protein